jgi:NADH:ubiquinone oxidoreductase subunit 3 (subunit A)
MGSIVSAALMLAAAVGAIIMRQLLQTENKRRDRLQPDETGPVALGSAADKDPNFRYVL